VIDRLKAIRRLLVVYSVGSVVIAVPLLFSVEHAGSLSGTTSGRVLAAALIAMAVGALGAARDPWGERLMIRVLILFTALSALAIVYRLVTHAYSHDPAWIVLLVAVAASALLAYFYPRQQLTAASGDSGSRA